MADVITELRRPGMLGAVIFAAFGWILLAWSFAQSSQDQDLLRAELGQAQKRVSQLSDELKTERAAAGTLVDVTSKRDAADAQRQTFEAAAREATRQRDEAQAALADLNGKVKNTSEQKVQADRALADAGAQRDKVAADLDLSRQQIETVKQAFIRASEQVAQKNSELASLNEKAQAAQVILTKTTADQAAASQALAATRESVNQGLADRDAIDKRLALDKAQADQQRTDAQRNLDQLGQQIEAAKGQLASLEQQIAAREKTLAAPASP